MDAVGEVQQQLANSSRVLSKTITVGGSWRYDHFHLVCLIPTIGFFICSHPVQDVVGILEELVAFFALQSAELVSMNGLLKDNIHIPGRIEGLRRSIQGPRGADRWRRV